MTVTIPQKRAIATGLITLLAGALVLGVADVARNQIIFRPEFELVQQRQGAAFEAHDAKLNAKLDRVLDVVCEGKPALRQCDP